jgi:hypothetical protein
MRRLKDLWPSSRPSVVAREPTSLGAWAAFFLALLVLVAFESLVFSDLMRALEPLQ